MFHQRLRQLPKSRINHFVAWIAVDAERPAEHSDNISVQNGAGLVVGDAANGAGGVWANAWQLQNGCEGSRELPVLIFQEQLRSLLQVAHAGVITKPLP